jgi:hypothetical protein
MVIVPVIAYVPAASATVCPLGHDASAELICASVAEDVRLAQFVVRAGIPPTPTLDQSMARLESRIVDHNWA